MRRFTLLTIVFLLLALTFATIYQLVLVQGKPRGFPGPGISGGEDKVVLNDVTGLQREEAVDTLEAVDLAYRVIPRADGELTDEVIAQAPPPGSVLQKGTVVTLTVRCRPAPCPSPGEGEETVDPCSCATA